MLDSAGNLYGTAPQTTTGDETGTLFRLSPWGSGWNFDVLVQFNSNTGVNPWAGLLQDQAGNLYGATEYEGSSNGGTVFQMSPRDGGWNFNLLYNLPQGAVVGGPYAALLMDGAGNLYGTTVRGGQYGYGSVFKLTATNGGYSYTSLHSFTGNSGSDAAYPEGKLALGADSTLYGTASAAGYHGFQCGSGCGTVWEIKP